MIPYWVDGELAKYTEILRNIDVAMKIDNLLAGNELEVEYVDTMETANIHTLSEKIKDPENMSEEQINLFLQLLYD